MRPLPIGGTMIRTAIASDEAAIRFCAETAYQRYVAAIGRKPAPMLADFAAQIAEGHVHVACAGDGALLGFIVFFARHDHMLLENVAVLPAAAGRGIGRQLIAFCEQAARQQGLERVELYTNEKMTENIFLYPHLGYREVDRRSEDGFNRVFFAKNLAATD